MPEAGGTANGVASPRGEGFPRVALGPGAPTEMAEFIGHAGVEVLPFTQRHSAALYVDFVGARPPGVELLSIDLSRRATGALHLWRVLCKGWGWQRARDLRLALTY